MYVELVFVNTIIVSLWNTMRNHTSHNVDITCAVAPWTYVPVGHKGDNEICERTV